MAEVIYSAQRTGFLPGASYRNPRYFTRPLFTGIERVTVVGRWPKVVEAYEALGLEVNVIPEGSAVRRREPLPPPPPGVTAGAQTGDDLVALRAAYQARIGKRPFMGWDAEILKAKIAEAAPAQ